MVLAARAPGIVGLEDHALPGLATHLDYGRLIESDVPVLTVEDHHSIGGFGACVLESCNDSGLPTDGIFRLGLPDRWIYQGSRTDQQAEAGIDADGIVRTVERVLKQAKSARSRRRVAARRLSALP